MSGARNRVEEWEAHLLSELRESPGTIGDLTLRMGLSRGATSCIAPVARGLEKRGAVEMAGRLYYLAGTAPRPNVADSNGRA